MTRFDRRALWHSTALATSLLGAVPALAQLSPTARPQDGTVVGGGATITQSPALTAINQSTPRAAIDWRSFDIGAAHTVAITARAPTDVTLNRVTGPDPSVIAGRLTANNQVVLVNQSGVVFSRGSQVDTAGLVVSAAGIRPSAFMAGSLAFDQAPRPGAAVVNQGTLTVRQSGLAALVAPQVANSGTITARMGHVVLAGARAHTVDLYGDGLVSINVTGQVTQADLGGQAVDALVTNSGMVRADGGTVALSAHAVDGVVRNLVSAGGTVAADGADGRTGTVLVSGVGGDVRVTGTLSAQGQRGGTVSVQATGYAEIAGGARVTASGAGGGGTVLLGTGPCDRTRRGRAGRRAHRDGRHRSRQWRAGDAAVHRLDSAERPHLRPGRSRRRHRWRGGDLR